MAEISSFAFPNEAGQTRTTMRDLPTGTVTLLFTDIEGSTLLLQQVGERYASVLSECRDLLRTAFSEYYGYEVDTQGDGFFVVFVRAREAIRATMAAQRAQAVRPDFHVTNANAPAVAEICVRLDGNRARIRASPSGGRFLARENRL